MTGWLSRRTNAKLAFSGLALACATTMACGTTLYEVPVETPIPAKLDVSAFQRVLVAGFVAGGADDIDTNQETVRLLRSQLRSKSELRVIDADVMQLVDVAQEQNRAAANDSFVR
jgi:hypothetical protein